MSALTVAVRTLVSLLVNGEYDVAAALTRGDRLPAEEIREAVDRYGRTLTDLPESEWSNLDVLAVEGRAHPTYSVVVDLWTVEEGHSDLTLELELVERYPGAFETRIIDLHVL